MICYCIRDASRITAIAVPDPDCPKHPGGIMTPILGILSTIGVALVLLVEILSSGGGRHRR